MATIRDNIQGEMDDLKRIRDELRVQGHLAKAEAKDLWQRMEQTWTAVELSFRRLEEESSEAAEHIQ